MNVAMVDDNPEDLNRLRDALREYEAASGTELNFCPFSGGEQFLRAFWPFLYTVVFLDIYLDGLSGIQIAERIRDADDAVFLVFLTDSNERQADAIHWNAYDYLLKSDCPEAVWKVMDRILHQKTAREEKTISFTTDHRTVILPYADLVFVQADRNYLAVRDRRGTEYRTRVTYSSVRERLLQDRQFLELTRGCIVNLNYAADFTGNSCILQDGGQLPVTARHVRRLSRIWRNFLFFQARNSMDAD